MASRTKDSFRNNPHLKSVGTQISYTHEQIKEWLKCQADPVYFTKKYVKIVSLDHGLIPFELRDYQQKFIELLSAERFVITLQPRQVGKTATVVAYFLWLTLFHDSQKIALVSHKKKLSIDILSRYKIAYEALPLWLQQGIIRWNAGDVGLENGSIVRAEATTSTSLTGESFNIVFMDEFAKVPPNVAEAFFTSVYPVITSGTTTKIFIVSTANGLNHFYKIWAEALDGKNGYVPYEVHWRQVPGRDDAWRDEVIKNTSERQFEQEFENCVDYNTIVTIKNKKTGIIQDIKIGDLYNLI